MAVCLLTIKKWFKKSFFFYVCDKKTHFAKNAEVVNGFVCHSYHFGDYFFLQKRICDLLQIKMRQNCVYH